MVESEDANAIVAAALVVLEQRAKYERCSLTSPSAVRDYLRLRLAGLEHEVFAAVLLDAHTILGELHAKGVDLYLHRQGVDTTTPAGKALFQMLGVFAEFERAMIVERVNAGLARARDKGTRSGRPIGRPRVEISKEHRIRELRRKGVGLLKIAREVGCGTSVVQRVLAAAR